VQTLPTIVAFVARAASDGRPRTAVEHALPRGVTSGGIGAQCVELVAPIGGCRTIRKSRVWQLPEGMMTGTRKRTTGRGLRTSGHLTETLRAFLRRAAQPALARATGKWLRIGFQGFDPRCWPLHASSSPDERYTRARHFGVVVIRHRSPSVSTTSGLRAAGAEPDNRRQRP
jgi:hypothetical protein